MKTYNSLTAMRVKWKGEVNELVSETVPDQALTPQELLRRFATGQSFDVTNQSIYDSDYQMELPEFDKMDKLDRLHKMQENSFNIKELYESFSDERKKAEAKAKNDNRSVAKVRNDKPSVSASAQEKISGNEDKN